MKGDTRSLDLGHMGRRWEASSLRFGFGGVECLGFRVECLGFRVECLGCCGLCHNKVLEGKSLENSIYIYHIYQGLGQGPCSFPWSTLHLLRFDP